MIKKTLILLACSIFLWINTPDIYADVGAAGRCTIGGEKCIDGYSCQPDPVKTTEYYCQKDIVGGIFGKIQPPPAIKTFLGKDVTGTAGISKFLSNLVTLIYTVATIILIFMLLWGAFDWMVSEGNKEKLQAAQNKIISAIIGLMLFAVAFAIIAVLGKFTGFTFFAGQ